MANINDYYIIIKELYKIANNLQMLISPNIETDIENLRKGIIGVKHHIVLARHNLDKTARFIKLKKHKSNRKKKKSNKIQ